MTPIVAASGAEIPAIGFGTWQLKGDTARQCVQTALDTGYRHIDTAAMYGNESEVGEAIRAHGTRPGEVFVTTKVWSSDLADGQLQRSAEASLKRLGMDQVDLLLIHWPSRGIPFAEQIHALCDAKRRGLTRHIGVSNFPPRFVEAALKVADEPIAVNQVEHHPYLDQRELMAVCARHDIALTSYSPLGRGRLLEEPALGEIATARGKTAAQIVLRWHLQQPMNIAIPRSSSPRRISENFSIFDFELSADEMARISGLARPDGRMVNAGYPSDWNGAPES